MPAQTAPFEVRPVDPGTWGILGLENLNLILHSIVKPLEENERQEYYGAEYRAYTRAVPRLIPCWGRMAKPGSSR